MFRLWCFVSMVACLFSIAAAAPSASTFIDGEGKPDNFTFSFNVNKNNDEIYFRMTGSANEHSWIAAGPGDQMSTALMFIAYEGNKPNTVTLSARMANGNVEPFYSPYHNVTLLPGSGIFDGTFVVNAVCANCRAWDGKEPLSLMPRLNVTDKAQPFIYALGPPTELETNALDAGLQRHMNYGSFTLDMVQAGAGDAGVPEDVSKNTGSSSKSEKRDYDFALNAHWVFTVGAFLFLFPLGVIFLRIFNSVKLHWINQIAAASAVLIGAGLGIYMSKLYDRTKKFNTAHQIIGLVVFSFVFVQAALGYFHHRQFQQTQRRALISHAHIWVGKIVIFLGILNGFFGLRLSGRPGLFYTVVVLAVAVGYTLLFFLNGLRIKRKNRAYNNPRNQNFQQSYEPHGSQADIPLATAGSPPAYSPPPQAASRSHWGR